MKSNRINPQSSELIELNNQVSNMDDFDNEQNVKNNKKSFFASLFTCFGACRKKTTGYAPIAIEDQKKKCLNF